MNEANGNRTPATPVINDTVRRFMSFSLFLFVSHNAADVLADVPAVCSSKFNEHRDQSERKRIFTRVWARLSRRVMRMLRKIAREKERRNMMR